MERKNRNDVTTGLCGVGVAMLGFFGLVILPAHYSYHRQERKIKIENTMNYQKMYEDRFDRLFGKNGLADTDLSGNIDGDEYKLTVQIGGFLGEIGVDRPPLEVLERAIWSFRTESLPVERLNVYGAIR